MPNPLIGPLIGAGADLLGGLFSSGQSARQAQRQMDFQERMSSTAHQREVADLRAAGLNPILSVNAGASSPGGAMGQVPDMSRKGSDAVNSALAAKRLNAELSLIAAQGRNVEADTRLKDAALPTKGVIGDAVSSGRNAFQRVADQIRSWDKDMGDKFEDARRIERVHETERRARAEKQRRALEAGSARMEARRRRKHIDFHGPPPDGRNDR